MLNLRLSLMVCGWWFSMLLASCQRPPASAAEQNQTEAKTEKSLPREKDSQYSRKFAPAQKEQLQQATVKDKLDELDYKTFYERGYQKHNAGDFSGAISDFNKCLSLNPDFSDAYNFRGMSKYKSGDKPGACSDWKKAAALGYTQAQSMIDSFCE